MATSQPVLPPSSICQLCLRNRGLNSIHTLLYKYSQNHKRLPSSWGQSSNTAARGEQRQRRCVPSSPGSASLGEAAGVAAGTRGGARRRLAWAAKSAGSPADCISRKSLEAVFPHTRPQRAAFLPNTKIPPLHPAQTLIHCLAHLG